MSNPSDATYSKQNWEEEFCPEAVTLTYASADATTGRDLVGSSYPRRQQFLCTLTGNFIINAPSAPRDGQRFEFYLTASGGARTLSFGTGIVAPTLRSAGSIVQNKTRMIELTYNGTEWNCTDDWEEDLAMAIGAGDVDSAEIAEGAVDLVHMSANSVDSDQYVDGSIDLAHMSANSVDSDQYVDGSIDNVHLAGSITFAKLAVAPKSILTIPVSCGTIVDGDIVTGYVPGFKGKIVKASWLCTQVTTDADGATTLNLEIGTTNLTGGVITVNNAACKTLGLVTDGTAISGNNSFNATDAISIEASSTTAFNSGADGFGAILLVVEQTD
jgi:hypothetical protein